MGALTQKMNCQLGPGRDRSTDEHPGGDAEAADRTPHRQRGLALRAVVAGGDQRQRRRGEERGAEALEGACDEELGARVRQAADDGRGGEQPQTGQEDTAAGQQVRDAAAEEQAAAGHHQVRRDQPLQLSAVEVEVGTDGRQGGVHHGDVEDDEDLRGEGDGQQRPRPPW